MALSSRDLFQSSAREWLRPPRGRHTSWRRIAQNVTGITAFPGPTEHSAPVNAHPGVSLMSLPALPVSTSDLTQLQAGSVTGPELDAVHAPLQPIVPRSSQTAFQKAIATIAKRINNAKSVVAFPIAGVV
jgi:hypothetical protein